MTGHRSVRWLVWPASALTVALVLPLAALFASAWVGGWRLQVVETSSMDPAFPAGSMLVSKPVEPSAVRPGMVIGFDHPDHRGRVVSHRVVRVVERPDGLQFRTKGDANRRPDSELVPAGDVRSQVAWHIPDLGAVVRWLAWPRGFVLLVLLPAAVLLAGEARDVRRRRRGHEIVVREGGRRTLVLTGAAAATAASHLAVVAGGDPQA